MGAYLGVDPGASGGIAMVDGDLAQVWAFKKLTERDISDLFECFEARGNVEEGQSTKTAAP